MEVLKLRLTVPSSAPKKSSFMTISDYYLAQSTDGTVGTTKVRCDLASSSECHGHGSVVIKDKNGVKVFSFNKHLSEPKYFIIDMLATSGPEITYDSEILTTLHMGVNPSKWTNGTIELGISGSIDLASGFSFPGEDINTGGDTTGPSGSWVVNLSAGSGRLNQTVAFTTAMREEIESA